MPDDLKRNYLKEAVQIASGTSRFLPQREHLMALSQEFEQALALNQTYGEVMAVLLRFAQTENFPISAAALMEVRAQKTLMYVERLADGGVIVKARQVSPPIPQASKEVM